MEKREGLKKKEKAKSNALFDVLNDIKTSKCGTLLDGENTENEKAFSNYMALRFLSMSESLCPLVNTVNHIQDVLDKKEMYKLLVELIPETNSYDAFIKAQHVKYEYENDVASYYECTIKEAREYIDIMGIDWAHQIHNSFGGKL